MITLDEKSHIYRDAGGRVVPGVTGIIGSVYPYECHHPGQGNPDTCPDCTYCRDLGTATHAATAYHDRGTLDMATVDPAVLPRLRQWKEIVEALQPKVVAIEKLVYFRGLYAGTIDRVWKFTSSRVLVDIKPRTKTIASRLQTGAYKEAWDFMHPKEKINERWIIHLDGTDGPARIEKHSDKADGPAFMNLLYFKLWEKGAK